MCDYLRVGDKVIYRKKLCSIRELRPDGVMLDCGKYSKFIFCTDLANREFGYVVEWVDQYNVLHVERPLTEKSYVNEQNLLRNLGYKVVGYREEILKE